MKLPHFYGLNTIININDTIFHMNDVISAFFTSTERLLACGKASCGLVPLSTLVVGKKVLKEGILLIFLIPSTQFIYR